MGVQSGGEGASLLMQWAVLGGFKSTSSKSQSFLASLIQVLNDTQHLCSTLATLVRTLALGWLPGGPPASPEQRGAPPPHPVAPHGLRVVLAPGRRPDQFCDCCGRRQRGQGKFAVTAGPPARPQLHSQAQGRKRLVGNGGREGLLEGLELNPFRSQGVFPHPDLALLLPFPLNFLPE